MTFAANVESITATGATVGWPSGHLLVGVEGHAATPERPAGLTGLIAVEPIGGRWWPVLERPEPIGAVRQTPDGACLALLDRGPNPGLWVRDRRRLDPGLNLIYVPQGGSFAMPASGDQLLVFESEVKLDARPVLRANCWRIAVDGGSRARIPLDLAAKTEGARYRTIADCSSDGRWLLLGVYRNRRLALDRVRADGGETVQLLWPDERGLRPRFAPDGRRIVFVLATPQGESLWIMDAAGHGRQQVIAEAPVTIVPRWSPDGTHLALLVRDCIVDERGTLRMPECLDARRTRIEVVATDGGGRRAIDFPARHATVLGDWVP